MISRNHIRAAGCDPDSAGARVLEFECFLGSRVLEFECFLSLYVFQHMVAWFFLNDLHFQFPDATA